MTPGQKEQQRQARQAKEDTLSWNWDMYRSYGEVAGYGSGLSRQALARPARKTPAPGSS